MKFKYLFIYILISLLFVNLNVYAINDAAVEGDSNYSSLENSYNKYNNSNSERISVKGSQRVTIYGKSECNGSSCTYKYAGVNGTNFKEALSKFVSCSNGEKYFVYQNAGSGKDDYLVDNNAKANGTVYWSEEYQITCTNTSSNTGGDTLQSNGNTDSQNGNTGSQSGNTGSQSGNTGSQSGNTGSQSGNTGSQSGSNNGEYDSSTPGDVSETGVNTYFVVLGLVAAISFGFMLIVKKYNLFKSI